MTNRSYFRRILSLLLVSLVFLAGCGKSTSEATPIAPSQSEGSLTFGQPNFEGMDRSDRNSLEYTAVRSISSDAEITGEVITSSGKDENALLVTNGTVKISGSEISRDSSDSSGGDKSSFYGIGSSVLCTAGKLEINDSKITGNANGAAGVFAYGEGTVEISNSDIYTVQGASGGIHVAGGGTLYANNVTAVTEGQSSAAIRSDRGGGLLVAEGGNYTSNGIGSPAIYCTANICAKDADLKATGSEAVCIEGLNNLYLYNSNLSGAMKDNEQNECTWNVILYQSMSGDSQIGNSTFQMEGGQLQASNGGMFYTTNTESTFVLKEVNLIPAENSPFLLRCTGNKNARGWGKSGENGADCVFTAISQNMNGNVQWDSISTLSMYLTEGSVLEGLIIQDDSCAGNGGNGYADLYIDDSSKWIVTESSYLGCLSCEGTITDKDGQSVPIVSRDGTVLCQGESNCTITVDKFNTSADFSGASKLVAFNDAQINNGGISQMGTGAPPEMPNGGFNGQQPPEMPNGGFNGQQPPEMPNGGFNGQQPPEMPNGGFNGQQPPEMPDNVLRN